MNNEQLTMAVVRYRVIESPVRDGMLVENENSNRVYHIPLVSASRYSSTAI